MILESENKDSVDPFITIAIMNSLMAMAEESGENKMLKDGEAVRKTAY